ncbi:MAG TPA: orotidine 5'-phosphate decarboxylase / HUMPS family protein, partial [Acidimicrobiales bacterium]
MTVETPTHAAVPEALRARLALALDVDDLVAATRLARDLQPWFGTMKVGLELFGAAGPDAIVSLSQLGVDVFADLKLHDIPNTVGRAARVLGALGARYVTLHTSGGVAMLRAGVQGLREGAASAGQPEPTALAVTVLTSDPEWSEHLVRQRAVAGLEAGCGGFVCSVPDLPL